MKELIKKFLIEIIFGNTLKAIKGIFKFLKIVYFDYILRLFNACFGTLVIIAEKFSSVVFLLALITIICFCVDIGFAIYRTMIHFLKEGTLEVSPMIMDSKILITTVSMYGAKSIVRRFADMKKDNKNDKSKKTE